MSNPATTLSFASAYRQLRPAEKVFVDGYVRNLENDAAKRGERISNALYRVIPDSVLEASGGMLERPMVRAAISERVNDLAAATELTPARVIKELMTIGFASMGDYMEVREDGQPYFDLAKCTPEQLAAIASIEVEEIALRNGMSRKFKLKLHDKLSALDKIAKYIGLLEAENPFWRSENARPVDQAALPNGVTTEHAADLYAQMINDDR